MVLGAVKVLYNELSKVKQKGSFAQNVSIVFGGNVANLLLQVGLAPIISRIYGPEAYGEYAYYNLVISNIIFFSAFSLPSVYVLPKTRMEYLALGKLVVFSTIGITCMTLPVFLLLYNPDADYELLYIAVPVVIVLLLSTSVNGVLSAWNSREKRFGKNISTDVQGNLLAKSGVIGLGYFLLPTGLGLLSGDLFKALLIFFTQTCTKNRLVVIRFFLRNNWRFIYYTWKKHINVPKFVFPSQVMSKWTTDLPILMIGSFYGKETIGHYIFAVTILNLPTRLFENSIRPVMLKKAVDISNSDSRLLADLLVKSLKITLAISLIPGFVIALISPEVFSLAFGPNWHYAGKIVLLIGIQYIMQSVIAPYMDFWRVLKREKQLLTINSVNILLKLFPLSLMFLGASFEFFLVIFTSFSSVGSMLILSDLLFSQLDKQRAAKIIVFISAILGVGYYILLLLFVKFYSI